MPAPTEAEPWQLLLMVPQFRTEAVLRERLTELGGHVAFGTELTGFTQDAEGVTATLTSVGGGETIRARYLVGADGGRSFVRHALGIGFPGKTLGVRAIVADLTLTGLGREVWHRFGEGSMERQIGICPLAGTEMFQIQGPVGMEGEVDLSPAGLTALIRDRTGLADLEVGEVFWASAFQMNARLADRYRDGRVFLAGDAAHTHPPTGGQGLNTSLQDAWNLGWKLAAVLAGAPDVLLDSYETERRPVAAAMLGLATDLLEAMKRGEMRRGRSVGQLDIGYPGSPLSREMPERRGGLLAGDRAPDALLRGAGGQPRRFFDLLRGPHWTLLGHEVGRLSQITPRPGLHIHATGPQGDLSDETGHFAETYGMSPGDRVLIRPDGYIGALFAAGNEQALGDYLNAVGLAEKP